MISKKKKKTASSRLLGGCLCKCALITTLILAALTMVVSICAFLWIKNVVEHLTIEGNHRSFPVVDMTDVDRELLKDRVKLFVDELRRGDSSKTLEDLVITQDEINGFLCHSDYLRGNFQVTLEDNSITEEYSLPMGMFPGGKGRYFDGHDYTKIDPTHNRMELKMETKALHKDWFVGPLYFLQLSYDMNEDNQYHQQLLEIFLENGSIFGNAIPEDTIRQHQNLMEDAYADPDSGMDVRTVVSGIEGVKIQKGKIVIMPRRRHHDEDIPVAVPIPANPYPIESEGDDSTYIELDAEPVVMETEEEPIVVELIPLEELPEGDEKEMDYSTSEAAHGAKPDGVAKTQAISNKRGDSTFLRANNVPAVAPTKAFDATTSHLRSNP
jgi:hypothetical protein